MPVQGFTKYTCSCWCWYPSRGMHQQPDRDSAALRKAVAGDRHRHCSLRKSAVCRESRFEHMKRSWKDRCTITGFTDTRRSSLEARAAYCWQACLYRYHRGRTLSESRGFFLVVVRKRARFYSLRVVSRSLWRPAFASQSQKFTKT